MTMRAQMHCFHLIVSMLNMPNDFLSQGEPLGQGPPGRARARQNEGRHHCTRLYDWGSVAV
jgi:hypothetical protein